METIMHIAQRTLDRCAAQLDEATVCIKRLDEENKALLSELTALREKHEALREAAVHIYNSGYHAGHHDTVEGRYVDIVPADMDTYHAEDVDALIEALTT